MKLERYHGNPILAKNQANHWEAGSVLNPCVIRVGETYAMYYRATNDIRGGEKGGYISYVGYATSPDGMVWTRRDEPVVTPSESYDEEGCEDPRVTKIGDTYYMHYTAIGFEPGGDMLIRIALATSSDGVSWTKHGIVGPAGSRSKAATLFPEAINGKYWWFYTWESDRPESTIMSVAADTTQEVVAPPAGQLAMTLEHYDTWSVFAPPSNDSTLRGAEVGAPPIKTESGWLFIYCNANTSNAPEWTVKAALLDLNDPRKVLAVTPEPILRPETEDERTGVVNNVTFPEGAVIVGEDLFVYYGSGDQGCCLATCNARDLIHYLTDIASSK